MDGRHGFCAMCRQSGNLQQGWLLWWVYCLKGTLLYQMWKLESSCTGVLAKTTMQIDVHAFNNNATWSTLFLLLLLLLISQENVNDEYVPLKNYSISQIFFVCLFVFVFFCFVLFCFVLFLFCFCLFVCFNWDHR